MAADKAQALVELVAKGMSQEEAENFLNSKVGYVKLELPPDSAAKILTALSKLSIISQPVEVTFCVAEDRIQALGDVAQEVSGCRMLNAMITPDTPVC